MKAKVISKASAKILKYGAIGTAGLGVGGYLGAYTSGEPQFRTELASNAAMKGLATGVLLTGAALARKPLSAIGAGALKGAMKGYGRYMAGGKKVKNLAQAAAAPSEGMFKVIFRRIRGRIVPIRVK